LINVLYSEEDDEDKRKRKKRPWVVMESRMPYVALPEYSLLARDDLGHRGPPVLSSYPSAPMGSWTGMKRKRISWRKTPHFTTTTDKVYNSWHRLPPNVKFQPYTYHHGLSTPEDRHADDNKHYDDRIRGEARRRRRRSKKSYFGPGHRAHWYPDRDDSEDEDSESYESSEADSEERRKR
jgi:hypothetical protein